MRRETPQELQTVPTTSNANDASRAMTVAAVDANDRLVKGDYRHINFGLRDLAAGGRRWKFFFVKLQSMDGKFQLELRRNDLQPSSFSPWPETFTKDEWGDYLRVAIGPYEYAETERLREFVGGLGDVDREAVDIVLGGLPACLRKAVASLPDASGWEPGLAALEATCAAVAEPRV